MQESGAPVWALRTGTSFSPTLDQRDTFHPRSPDMESFRRRLTTPTISHSQDGMFETPSEASIRAVRSSHPSILMGDDRDDRRDSDSITLSDQTEHRKDTFAPSSEPAALQGPALQDPRLQGLLNADTAAQALADLAASLRWSSKFPEGAHKTRARSGAFARRLSGVSLSDAQKHRGSDATLVNEPTGPEGHEEEVDGFGKDGYLQDGNLASTAETRQGLRFLATRRSELESDLSGGFNDSNRKARWSTFKIVLAVSMVTILAYGLFMFIGALLTWARTWSHAEVSITSDGDIVIFVTLAGFLCVITAVIGICGLLLNSRPILAMYTFLLWPTLVSMLIVGYTSYKRANLRLDRKLNMAWSRTFSDVDRLRLQNILECCGYYSPLHQATFSRQCYPRTSLPGCKGTFFRYEGVALRTCYKVTFSLVAVHLWNIATALLCSNHVNNTFGKGLTPRQYRLDMEHVRRNAKGIMKVLVAEPLKGH